MSLLLGQSGTLYERVQDYIIDEAQEAEETTFHTFTIHIGEITGLRPVYPSSLLTLVVEFDEEEILKCDDMLMAEAISIDQDINLTLNLEDLNIVNKFISCPITFALIETETTTSPQEITEVGKTGPVLWRSEESVLNLEEALFGKKQPVEHKPSKKGIKKTASKSSKASKGSIDSKKLKGKHKPINEYKDVIPPKASGPQVAGSASIDLIPFFRDALDLEQSLVLKAPAGQALDDRMKSASNLPILQIRITLDRAIPPGNIFYYSLESIYNLPKVMSANMDYQIAMSIPINLNSRLISFNKYKYATEPRTPFCFKKYFGTDAESKFMLRDDFDDVKSNLPLDMSDALPCDFPRLEYNVIKGEYVTKEDIEAFRVKLMKYRCIGVEVYMTNPSVVQSGSSRSPGAPPKKDEKKSKRGGSKTGSKKGDVPPEKTDEEFLHLMAFIDLCRLLCPGATKTRVACQLRTFNLQEFEEVCGVNDSYFRPKPPSVAAPEPKTEKPKKDKSPKKESNKSDKSSKTGKKVKGQGDLRSKLPPPPAKPPTSEPVYDENGNPTFIIMEFEFRQPLIYEQDVEDLHEQLEDIINALPQGPNIPRFFNSKYIAKDIFQETIMELSRNLKQLYFEYLDNEGKKDDLEEFLTYVNRSEEYPTYITTLTKAASTICNIETTFETTFNKDEYEAYIGNAYVDLVSMLNSTLTQITIAGDASAGAQKDHSEDTLFYAKEAVEIDALGLATRYYLQRIADNENSPEPWFDYAIFKLQQDEPEAAEECAAEALRHSRSHRNSLLLFACLIARKGKISEAETCLLNITLTNPKWAEGWMALYCVYQRNQNVEGMELCLEMADKYANAQNWNKSEDMLWTANGLPDKYTYHTIIYFINMRLYDEAELLIAEELIWRQTDLIEYLLAVIDCYKGRYEHAMDHINTSLRLGGCSYQKNALRGHILAFMNQEECALEEYEKILKSTSGIPFDQTIYLVYVRAGLCYSMLGKDQDARRVILYAAEKSGTPYSWLAVGVLYYHQKDYMSAEECLTISNSLDNVMPETWAYLTLVNIKLGRPNEASNCYHQAIDNKLQNEELLKQIDDELKIWEEDTSSKGYCNQSTE